MDQRWGVRASPGELSAGKKESASVLFESFYFNVVVLLYGGLGTASAS